MHIINDIKTVYATNFCNNDIKQAKSELEKQKSVIRQSDLAILSFLSGGIIIFILIMFFYAVKVNPEIYESDEFWNALAASNPIMRSMFVICYILFAVGLCIMVFRKNEINYMHIF